MPIILRLTVVHSVLTSFPILLCKIVFGFRTLLEIKWPQFWERHYVNKTLVLWIVQWWCLLLVYRLSLRLRLKIRIRMLACFSCTQESTSHSCYINTPEQVFTDGAYKLFKSLKAWLHWNSTYQHWNGKSWQTLQLVSHWVREQPGLLRFITDAKEQDDVIAIYRRCLPCPLSFSWARREPRRWSTLTWAAL